MSEVKPDCYCLGGDKAHFSEAKYKSLHRTYEQARDEAKHLYGECLMLADVLRDAYEVVKTIEDYQKASAKVKKDEMVVLLLSRQGNNLFVAVNPK